MSMARTWNGLGVRAAFFDFLVFMARFLVFIARFLIFLAAGFLRAGSRAFFFRGLFLAPVFDLRAFLIERFLPAFFVESFFAMGAALPRCGEARWRLLSAPNRVVSYSSLVCETLLEPPGDLLSRDWARKGRGTRKKVHPAGPLGRRVADATRVGARCYDNTMRVRVRGAGSAKKRPGRVSVRRWSSVRRLCGTVALVWRGGDYAEATEFAERREESAPGKGLGMPFEAGLDDR